MDKVFNVIRGVLRKNFSLRSEDIQPEARFEIELALDSSEMLELISEFESTFGIEISYDDVDSFVFHKTNTKMTIQDAVNYISRKVKERDNG